MGKVAPYNKLHKNSLDDVMEIPFFHHQQVRDLTWALFSPTLLLNLPSWVKNWQPKLNHQELRWLKALDQDPQPLLDHLKQANTGILGMHFEALWGFYLKNRCQRQLIKQNLQIQGNKQTLGEFDALLKGDRGQFYHLELACKFYLKAPKTATHHPLSHWLGPQCRDRLDIKLEKTLNQQLILSRKPEAQTLLTAMGIDRVQPEVIFKGWLFHPMEYEDINTNPVINAEGHKGIWLQQHHMKNLQPGRYQILSKQRWLSLAWQDHQPESLETLIAYCADHFKHKDFALMAVKMQPANNGWQETQRLMLVPEPWPY